VDYFIVVNRDKKEYITSWDLGSSYCFWLKSKVFNVLQFLIWDIKEDEKEHFLIGYKYLGRWVGDLVYLYVEYTQKQALNNIDEKYRNITYDLIKEVDDYLHKDLGSCYETLFAYKGFFNELQGKGEFIPPNSHSKK
jgi:hypothetical protein